ncbi:hypothetical protein FJ492_11090 [Mesorhizobium sp. B2-5-4]|nr:hypothetical protein FJ432_17520 [Mesorhizobium sp. B2-6-5]TPJ88091.1 hypothetical protein FJ434_11385 [Mesorhizobium sp. B2-5-13]TPK44791.1 hypothetical protein FJ492_11090 [Mesorhizobium sp. B2-5-4]TPK52286.1 hypothetical protein FJ560_06800 [Mesorhizobium sp. B2-5-5]TPL72687.1 hypothetical protein FJ941_27855 [Mesorhizobium sp. B2-3-13]
MSVQKEDYRTNRADYAIAAKRGGALADGGDYVELLARRKKALWLKDRRTARLAANPTESSLGSRPRLRG